MGDSMDSQNPSPRGLGPITIVHRGLVGGSTLLLAAVALAVHRWPLPPSQVRPALPPATIVFLALGIGSLLFGFLILRPRLPSPLPGQTVSSYWESQAAVSGAIVLWAVIDSSAVLGSIGYFATHSLALAVVALAGLLGLIACAPARLRADLPDR